MQTDIKTMGRLVVSIGIVLICGSAITGCGVTNQPGLHLEGGFIFEGSEGEGGQITCELPEGPSGASRFAEEWELRLPPAESGQSCPDGDCPGDERCVAQGNGDRICQVKPALRFRQLGAGDLKEFKIYFGVVNELSPSNTGDGVQGEFQLDTNIVQIEEAEIKFPPSLNNFAGGGLANDLNRVRKVYATLEPDGGSAVFGVPYIREGEFKDVREVFTKIIDRGGYDNEPGNRVILPFTSVVRLVGETKSGKTVRTNQVKIPIQMCLNCAELGTTCPEGSPRACKVTSATPTCVTSEG